MSRYSKQTASPHQRNIYTKYNVMTKTGGKNADGKVSVISQENLKLAASYSIIDGDVSLIGKWQKYTKTQIFYLKAKRGSKMITKTQTCCLRLIKLVWNWKWRPSKSTSDHIMVSYELLLHASSWMHEYTRLMVIIIVMHLLMTRWSPGCFICFHTKKSLWSIRQIQSRSIQQRRKRMTEVSMTYTIRCAKMKICIQMSSSISWWKRAFYVIHSIWLGPNHVNLMVSEAKAALQMSTYDGEKRHGVENSICYSMSYTILFLRTWMNIYTKDLIQGQKFTTCWMALDVRSCEQWFQQ